MTNTKAMKFTIDEQAANVVRKIFELYTDGWGYKKIANYLTENKIPTPRRLEAMRKEEAGEEHSIRYKNAWSIVTISEILNNDFYIGTLRQHKYTRKKINGQDEKLKEVDNIVIANNHQPIIDYKLFAIVQEQLKTRARVGYRGIKKFENVYTGHLFCGDCGSPMFSMSRANLPQAYRCGSYHNRGLKACTSHHIRFDLLDTLLKNYIEKVKLNSQDMIEKLQKSIDNEQKETTSTKTVIDVLMQRIEDTKTELKFLSRQHVKDIAKHPEREDMLEEVYQEQVDDLMQQIEGFRNQIQIETDKHNSVIAMNRTAKTVMDVFDSIINKESLTKNDIGFILDRIDVFEDRIDIKLKPDIDTLLRIDANNLEEKTITQINNENFECGTKNAIKTPYIAQTIKRKGEILSVNVVNNGSPSLTTLTLEYQFYQAIRDIAERLGLDTRQSNLALNNNIA